jgi:hypothetical protein
MWAYAAIRSKNPVRNLQLVSQVQYWHELCVVVLHIDHFSLQLKDGFVILGGFLAQSSTSLTGRDNCE